MILNFITWNVEPQILTIGSFELRWYSLLFGLGFIVSYYLLTKMFKKEGIPIELLDKLTMYVILATILGARLGHCIFYEPEQYLSQPWRMFLPFEGWPWKDFRYTGFQGLASHGGALGILVALWYYSKKFKVPYLWVLDRVVIVTAFAAFCIRTGNLFNSEIYGNPTDLPWGFKFMKELDYNPIGHVVVPKHPTQIYEALTYLLSFFILYGIYNKNAKNKKLGFFMGLFFILIFGSRFFIEFIKESQETFEEGMLLNMGQILSIPFVIAGLYLVFRNTDKKSVANYKSDK